MVRFIFRISLIRLCRQRFLCFAYKRRARSVVVVVVPLLRSTNYTVARFKFSSGIRPMWSRDWSCKGVFCCYVVYCTYTVLSAVEFICIYTSAMRCSKFNFAITLLVSIWYIQLLSLEILMYLNFLRNNTNMHEIKIYLGKRRLLHHHVGTLKESRKNWMSSM